MSILNPFIPPGPIASAFLADNSRRALIVGPYGSGKTVASFVRLYRHALEQTPGEDGVASSRYVVTRLTRPQLIGTTVKSFLQTFPENEFGTFERVQLRSHWRFRPPGFAHDVDIEWQFLALEDEDDVARVLGLEATAFFVNEARLIDASLLGKLTGRLRFPAVSKWRGILLDSNPWDTSHPFHEVFVLNRGAETAFFHQPGGLDKDAAGNPIGENLMNLNQTPESMKLLWSDPRRKEFGLQYYRDMASDMSPEDALLNVHSKFGVSREGKPVYGDYSDSTHCVPLKYDPALPLNFGTDFGLHSATVIYQTAIDGQMRVLAEFVTEDAGTIAHHERLRAFCERFFPAYTLGAYTGDPAGNQRGSDGRTVFAAIRAFFPTAQPARTNELATRHEAVNAQFRRTIRGLPALSIDDKRCPMLRQACVDRYFYKRQRGTGAQHSDHPEKNRWSHVAEALGYAVLGAGGGRAHVMAGCVASDRAFENACRARNMGAWDPLGSLEIRE